MVIELVQTRRVPFDADAPAAGSFPLRAGATLIVAAPAHEADGIYGPPRVRFAIASASPATKATRARHGSGRTGSRMGFDERRYRRRSPLPGRLRTRASRDVIVPKPRSASPPLANVLRVRMYRVGFGDFFLLTVPTADGPQHILIDCGVHAANIGSMPDASPICRRHAAQARARRHDARPRRPPVGICDARRRVRDVRRRRGVDHQSSRSGGRGGGGHSPSALPRSRATWRCHLQLRLRLGLDEEAADVARQALAKVENALGAGFGVAGGVNAKALDVVTRSSAMRRPSPTTRRATSLCCRRRCEA